MEEQQNNPQFNFADKTLAEISALFEALTKAEDRMERSKEAEALKAAFYRKLIKEKEAAGYGAGVDEPAKYEEEVFETPEAESAEDTAETPVEAPVAEPSEANPFDVIEQGFKAFYAAYKKERAAFNSKLEAEKEANLALKEAIIADLKALVEKEEEVNVTFPEFRAIQDRWKQVGPVPAVQARNINDTYHLYVEKFYDRVSIDRELRDLDFKKNLEVKEKFCEMAEKLAEDENVVEAFKKLQKLHEEWKEYGPVSKQNREAIWERFKAATAIINKKYQAHFEGMKAEFEANLAAKQGLCEQLEEIVSREFKSSEAWNAAAREIGDLQKKWKETGFAAPKDNRKVYERFRAACDKFFAAKKEFYGSVKEDLLANQQKKEALCEEAERLASSTDWQATTERLIPIQNEWKEIGAVPRKKSEQLWKRFREACDSFFNAKDEAAKARKAAHSDRRPVRGGDSRRPMGKSPKEKLIEQYRRMQQELTTSENNIGFFRSAGPLLEQMQKAIEEQREALKKLEAEIRQMEKKEDENNG